MASSHSSLLAFVTCFQRLSVLLLWSLLVARVEAQNASSNREVGVLEQFRQQVQVTPKYGVEPGLGYWGNWNPTDDVPCDWVGVTCTPKSTVEALDLSNWGLAWPNSGMQSLEILFNLTDLRRLDLSSNQLGSGSGTVPAPIPGNIGNFTNLIFLDLSGNGLGGEIPPSISACGCLQYLYLEQNSLDGEIPSLRDMTNLKVLSLADNQLVGQFPKELGEMNCIVSIDLSGNLLNGTIPSLSNMTNLLHLKLDNNSFTNFEEPWLSSESLVHLLVSDNQLEGQIPPGITYLLNLSFLNMSRNRLSSEIPSGLSRLQNRSNFWLDLSQNQLTGIIPADLLQPSNAFVTVNLSHNSLTGNIPFDGCDNTTYNYLDLSHNQLSGRISLMYTNSSCEFVWLMLQNNLLSEDIVDVFAAGPGFGLTFVLCLQNNNFTGDLSHISKNWSLPSGISWLGNGTNLEYLDLRNNNLQMSTSEGLSNLLDVEPGTLKELLIGGNNFSGTSLPTSPFTNPNSSLNNLDVSNSHLSGEISNAAFNNNSMPFLQVLNISHNKITGSIPQNIFMLPNLGVFDVSNNSLSGPLPNLQPGSRLYDPTFYGGNDLCGVFFGPCHSSTGNTGVHWWVWLIIAIVFVMIVVGCCLIVACGRRRYRKRHQQDVDLIKTLPERDSTTLMSLRELRRATNDFGQSAWLGEGGFGTVYVGILYDGTKVAIKRSKWKGSDKHKQQFLNEVRILSQVNHRHLVKLLGCCMENDIFLLVFEFVPNGTLQQHLRGEFGGVRTLQQHLRGQFGGVRLSWKQRLKIVLQTADALNYLHSAGTFPIYHRDVKSANILLSEDLNAKVADFGISRLVPIEATHISTGGAEGTWGYMDPDYFTSLELTDKSDVYSFGMVLLEVISAKPAIDNLRDGEEIKLDKFAYPYIERGDLEGLIDPILMMTYCDPRGYGRDSILNVGRLAMKCLDVLPKARPSMKEVWKVLQNIWLEFNETSQDLDSLNKDERDALIRQRDENDVLVESFSLGSSTYNFSIDTISEIEMSQSSRRHLLRSRSLK